MVNCKIIGMIAMIIFFASCANTIPDPKYMPKASDDVFPFFTKGQPIAAVQTEGAFILLSLEPTVLSNDFYYRLWILYQNISDEPYLLEPLQFTSLSVTSMAKRKSGMSTPESPTKILADISNEKALSMIVQAIGGTLQAMSAKPTVAETRYNDGSSATTTFNDQREKRGKVVDLAANSIANTAMWYEIYQNSISDGILRRNTVFPRQSVNGYIYFPYPSSRKMSSWDEDKNPFDLKSFIKVELELPGGNKSIYFTAIRGE